MSSNLKVNSLVPATGTEIGIGTTGGTIDFRSAATFGGNVTIGGTLTYDEVINIDSIGIITARTGLSVTAGDVVIPEYVIHTGDTNTKFGFSANDTFQVQTGGSARLTVTDASTTIIGLLDVNGSSTNFPVKASGSANAKVLLTGASSPYIQWQEGTTNRAYAWWDSGNNRFELKNEQENSYLRMDSVVTLLTGNAERFRIASDGDQTFTSTTGNAQFTFKKGDSPSGEETVFVKFDRNGTVIGGVGGAAQISGGESGNNMTLANVNGGQVVLGTGTGGGATARLRIDSSGRVLIGTATEGNSVADDLTIAGSGDSGITIRSGTSSEGSLMFSDATSGSAEHAGWICYNHNSNFLRFFANESERLRIDSGGRVLVGTTADVAGGATNSKLQIRGTSFDASLGITANRTNAGAGNISFVKTRGSGQGDATVVQDGDHLGSIVWYGGDGTDTNTSAGQLDLQVDGTPGGNDMPGRFVFRTTADGASSSTERLRITSTGRVGINETSPDRDLHISNTNPHIRVESTSANQPATLELYHTRSNGSDKWPSSVSTADGALTLNVANGNNGAPQEKVRINNDGNLMVGATSGSWAIQALRTSGTTTVASKNTGGHATVYIEASNTNTAKLELAEAGTGSYSLRVGNDNALMFFDDAAERMRIDDSGRLLLGRTSTHASSSEKLSVNGMVSFQNNTTTNSPLYCFNEDTTGSGAIQPFFFMHDGGGIRAGLGVQRSTGLGILNMQHGHSFRSGSSGVSGSEKMRITSGQGKVRIGMNSFDSGPSASNHGIEFANTNSASHWSATGTTTANHIIWMNPNGTCGSIKTSGTSTSYNETSDYRLKENQVAISDGITRVKQLKPYRFNFKTTPDETVDGFFAHEVQTVVPNAVTGTKDAVELEDTDYAAKDDIIPQQLDTAKLVPLLTAALQEAITEIETLKTKVAALESS